LEKTAEYYATACTHFRLLRLRGGLLFFRGFQICGREAFARLTKRFKRCKIIQSQPDGRGEQAPRGKSEHRRAERRLITGEGDFKESATEIYRTFLRARVEM
jgi:hypothetical protein